MCRKVLNCWCSCLQLSLLLLFSLKHQLVHSEPHPCPSCHWKPQHGGQEATKEHLILVLRWLWRWMQWERLTTDSSPLSNSVKAIPGLSLPLPLLFLPLSGSPLSSCSVSPSRLHFQKLGGCCPGSPLPPLAQGWGFQGEEKCVGVAVSRWAMNGVKNPITAMERHCW